MINPNNNLRIYFLMTVILWSLSFCNSKHSELEICFEGIKDQIKSEKILSELKNCPLDSSSHYTKYIISAVEKIAGSTSVCTKSVNKFKLENSNNSNTVNELLLFQLFQGYLNNKKVDLLEAKVLALEFLEKRYNHN